MDSESKQRVSLYLDKQTVKTVDMFIKKHGLHSRNEFFERAAENLIADEAIKTGGDVMSEKLAKAVENVSEDNTKAISKGLFRYAVQLEMLMRVIAKTNHFLEFCRVKHHVLMQVDDRTCFVIQAALAMPNVHKDDLGKLAVSYIIRFFRFL